MAVEERRRVYPRLWEIFSAATLSREEDPSLPGRPEPPLHDASLPKLRDQNSQAPQRRAVVCLRPVFDHPIMGPRQMGPHFCIAPPDGLSPEFQITFFTDD